MAEVESTEDAFSLRNQIERAEQRIARQRQIVEDLIKYNVAGPAQRLLDLMEHALDVLRQQEREQRPTAPVPEPAPEASPPQPEMATTE